jgi:hypothetical protein
MKLALAIAVIRSKPKSMSSGEYARTLALQFSDMQKDWKTKAEDLEVELLKVRQQLALVYLEEQYGSIDNDYIQQSSGYCSVATDWRTSGHSQCIHDTGKVLQFDGKEEDTGVPVSSSVAGHSLNESVVGSTSNKPVGGSEPVGGSQPMGGSILKESVDGSPLQSMKAEKAAAEMKILEANLRFMQKFARYRLLRDDSTVMDVGDLVPPSLLILTAAKAIAGVAAAFEETGKWPSHITIDSVQELVTFAVEMFKKWPQQSEMQELCNSCKHLTSSIVGCLSKQHWMHYLQSSEEGDFLSILCILAKTEHLLEIVALPLIDWMAVCLRSLEQAELDVTLLCPNILSSSAEVMGALCSILNDASHHSSVSGKCCNVHYRYPFYHR